MRISPQGSPWVVEMSLNRNSANAFYELSILNFDSEELVSQTERAALFLSVSRLLPIVSRVSVRYGLSFSDRGYREDLLIINVDGFHRSSQNIGMSYLGFPVALSFNMAGNRRFFSGFVEAGMLPELLLRQSSSDYMNFDLRRIALSGVARLGVKFNLRNGYALTAGPGLQYALVSYDRYRNPGPFESHPDGGLLLYNYRPLAVNASVGFQF